MGINFRSISDEPEKNIIFVNGKLWSYFCQFQSLRFDVIMEFDYVRKNLLATLIRVRFFAGQVLKYPRKCLMIPTYWNEQYGKEAGTENVSLRNQITKTCCHEIAERGGLIPWNAIDSDIDYGLDIQTVVQLRFWEFTEFRMDNTNLLSRSFHVPTNKPTRRQLTLLYS